MKTYVIFLFCFYFILLNSCNKNEENSRPIVGGGLCISIQNKKGENLLNKVETGSKDTTVIFRQNMYKLNCYLNGLVNEILLDQNFYLPVQIDPVTKENKSFGLWYAFTEQDIPDNGSIRYDFACKDIFGDEEYRSLLLKYETDRSNFTYYTIHDFVVADERITVEILEKEKRGYHVLLIVDDSK